nr:MAG TPA: Regulatory protein [Caudoviricetes sp.]
MSSTSVEMWYTLRALSTAGISQREIAEMTRIPKTTIASWARGAGSRMKADPEEIATRPVADIKTVLEAIREIEKTADEHPGPVQSVKILTSALVPQRVLSLLAVHAIGILPSDCTKVDLLVPIIEPEDEPATTFEEYTSDTPFCWVVYIPVGDEKKCTLVIDATLLCYWVRRLIRVNEASIRHYRACVGDSAVVD